MSNVYNLRDGQTGEDGPLHGSTLVSGGPFGTKHDKAQVGLCMALYGSLMVWRD